jgi:hypothetical protein
MLFTRQFSFVLAMCFVASCFLFARCKKDNAVPTGGYVPGSAQVVKEYTFFQLGTYWVYEEVSSGVLDSVYVTLADEFVDTVYEAGNVTGIYTAFRNELMSDLDGYTSRYFFDERDAEYCIDINGDFVCYQVTKGRYKPGDVVGEHQIFYYQFDIGTNLFLANPFIGAVNKLTLIDLKDNYQVGGVSFPAVAKFHLDYDLTLDDAEMHYYFGKGAGIVQRENIDSAEVWNLIRYNIVQ